MKSVSRILAPCVAVLAGAVALCASQDPSIFFSSSDLSFVLRGFTGARSARIDASGLSFSGEGNPLTVELRNLGVTLLGRRVEGSANRAADGSYVVQRANVTGGADVTISTSVREDWEISVKKRTTKSPTLVVTQVKAESISYKQSEGQGVVTTPGRTTMRSVSRGSRSVQRDGKAVVQHFEEIVEVEGLQSTIHVDPTAGTASKQIRTGQFEGPIEIKIVRNERFEGDTQGSVSTYTGKGDRMTLDFTGAERTITLSGRVTITGIGPDFQGNANATTATIVVDENLKPIRYEFSGTPTETRVRTGGDG